MAGCQPSCPVSTRPDGISASGAPAFSASCSHRGSTPLHFAAAAKRNALMACQALLRAGADPKTLDMAQRAPYESADDDKARTAAGLALPFLYLTRTVCALLCLHIRSLAPLPQQPASQWRPARLKHPCPWAHICPPGADIDPYPTIHINHCQTMLS